MCATYVPNMCSMKALLGLGFEENTKLGEEEEAQEHTTQK